MKGWASSMMSGEHYGSDKLLTYLSSRAHFILVQDRSTGQLRPEKVPFLVKLLFRFIYQSPLGRSAHSSFSIGLMARMTEMMGRKYDHESSRGHIAAFVAYYAIDLSEFDEPPGGYRTFNDFFFRRLKEGRRPIAGKADDSVLVSPADSRVTVFQSVSEASASGSRARPSPSPRCWWTLSSCATGRTARWSSRAWRRTTTTASTCRARPRWGKAARTAAATPA